MTTRRLGTTPAPRRNSTTPDANAIELFARVVAAGSFAQAARDLGLTRAAISRRVAGIEAQLGVPLFARTTRALGLTEAGRRLAQRARAMADAADAARRGMHSAARQGLAGTLRITSIPIFGQTVLAPLLARFRTKHPELRLELLLTHRRLDLLRDDVDVAFRLTAAPPADWVVTPLLSFAVRAYAAPGHGLTRPEDLARASCLVLGLPGQPQVMQWQRPGSRRRVQLALDPAVVADDLGTLLALARGGGGVVFAPDFAAAADVAAGQLVDALPGWRLPIQQGDQVVALTLPQPTAPEAARALVHFVALALGPRAGS